MSKKRKGKKRNKKFVAFSSVRRIKIGGTWTYQAMNDPMKKYVGFRSAIGCCESMTYAPLTTQF